VASAATGRPGTQRRKRRFTLWRRHVYWHASIFSRRPDRRTAQKATNNATALSGYPITILANASQPTESPLYSHRFTTNLDTSASVAMS
jgi:hypothetical protein